MKSYGLPQYLADQVIGSVPIVRDDGTIIGDRFYLTGDCHDASAYGTHVTLRSGKATLSRQPETTVDVETNPAASEYYFG